MPSAGKATQFHRLPPGTCALQFRAREPLDS